MYHKTSIHTEREKSPTFISQILGEDFADDAGADDFVEVFYPESLHHIKSSPF